MDTGEKELTSNQRLRTSAESQDSLTNIESKDIIDSWNRDKYPSFQDYLDSEEYEEWKESLKSVIE